MRIAVTTPTGNVGRHVVRGLIRAGQTPVLLARHPEHLADDLAGLVEVRQIDQFDPDSTLAATAGVDALYWVDPTTGGEHPLDDYARASAGVADAVRANGIGRVVFQSSIGAEKRHGAGEIDGLALTELALNEVALDEIADGDAGVAVTHLRCGYFFSNLLLDLDSVRSGRLEVVLPLDQPLAWVHPADIADVAVGLLLAPAPVGVQVQAVHGPADLTWPEAAANVSAAIGRPLTVSRIGDDEMLARLEGSGMSRGLAETVLGMSTGLRDGFTPEQPRTPRTTTSRTLGGWAYEELRPVLDAG